MIISKRKYYCNFLLCMLVVGVLLFMSAPVANKYLFHISIVNDICRYAIIMEGIIIVAVITIILIKNRGLKNFISNRILLSHIESNLISVGAYIKQDDKVFVELPRIKIKKGIIKISLKNLRIRTIIERYLDSLAIISLVAEIEEEFDVQIPTVEIVPENFNSVEAIWNLIVRLQEEE